MQLYFLKEKHTNILGNFYNIWYGFEHNGKFYQRTYDLSRLQAEWDDIVKWCDGEDSIPAGWKPL